MKTKATASHTATLIAKLCLSTTLTDAFTFHRQARALFWKLPLPLPHPACTQLVTWPTLSTYSLLTTTSITTTTSASFQRRPSCPEVVGTVDEQWPFQKQLRIQCSCARTADKRQRPRYRVSWNEETTWWFTLRVVNYTILGCFIPATPQQHNHEGSKPLLHANYNRLNLTIMSSLIVRATKNCTHCTSLVTKPRIMCNKRLRVCLYRKKSLMW